MAPKPVAEFAWPSSHGERRLVIGVVHESSKAFTYRCADHATSAT
jgi:hypothetical protein